MELKKRLLLLLPDEIHFDLLPGDCCLGVHMSRRLATREQRYKTCNQDRCKLRVSFHRCIPPWMALTR